MTVGELRILLAGYPDEMPVCVRTPDVAADYFCMPVEVLCVDDVWFDEEGGLEDSDNEDGAAVPTLVLNAF